MCSHQVSFVIDGPICMKAKLGVARSLMVIWKLILRRIYRTFILDVLFYRLIFDVYLSSLNLTIKNHYELYNTTYYIQ